MTATANTTRKTIAQLLAEQAADLVPVSGDKAYTFYHGRVWEGILVETESGAWVIAPANGQKVFAGNQMAYLPVGYKGLEGVATVDVYGPTEYNLGCEDPWHDSIVEQGYDDIPNKMVGYDVKRGMFYMRAQED